MLVDGLLHGYMINKLIDGLSAICAVSSIGLIHGQTVLPWCMKTMFSFIYVREESKKTAFSILLK